MTDHRDVAAPPQDDAVVIERSWAEPERFGAVFDAHYAEIHRYVSRRLGPQAGDDVSAETFALAFRQRRRYDVSRRSARPWLYGIATNLINRHRRDEVRLLRAVDRLHPEAYPAQGHSFAARAAEPVATSWRSAASTSRGRGAPAAGSPSSWTVGSSGASRTVRAKSGAWREDSPGYRSGGTFLISGVGHFTYRQLQELTADPEELRKLLCEGSVKFPTGGSGAPRRCDDPAQVLSRAIFVLVDTPVPPQVRAGLMRLITDYPGVRQLGAVTDPLGRPAISLAATFGSADGRGEIQREVLFDRRAGKVLGSRDVQLVPGADSEKWQVAGRVLNYRAVLDMGWSDTRPALPG
ncbi:sigma factor [Nonomuraea sp. NPDC048882]|uniref:sigma factor n=2 Tax=unclassified Nonomuraea TaxID=2593643 RepID=UPI0033C01E3F